MIRTDISVIIPVYNVEKYLDKCINSVIMQKEVNIEIILVDDGSSDKSGLICDNYANQYNNIKVIHKQNEGLGYARNSGLEIAKGKYIFFLDSDDWIVADALNKLLRMAEDNNADLVCFQLMRTLDENFVYKDKVSIEKYDVIDNHELMKRYIQGMSATACTKLYSNKIFEKHRFSNVPIHEDAYSMHLFLKDVRKAVVTDEIFYIQYVRKGSLVQSQFQQKNLICIECGDRLIEFAKEKYPDLVKDARINKLIRQRNILLKILDSGVYRENKILYSEIREDMKCELKKVGKLDKINEKKCKTIVCAAKYPVAFKMIYIKDKVIAFAYKIYSKMIHHEIIRDEI